MIHGSCAVGWVQRGAYAIGEANCVYIIAIFQSSLVQTSVRYSMADPLSLIHLCAESQVTTLITLKWILYSLSTFTVGLRLYFRLGTRGGLGADDYVIFASWASHGIY